VSDLLRMDYINSLGQLYGDVSGDWWPITLICVETGLCHIDVIGMTENKRFSDFRRIKDDGGVEYDPDVFYTDYEESKP
jgi:hypothetical protein